MCDGSGDPGASGGRVAIARAADCNDGVSTRSNGRAFVLVVPFGERRFARHDIRFTVQKFYQTSRGCCAAAQECTKTEGCRQGTTGVLFAVRCFSIQRTLFSLP